MQASVSFGFVCVLLVLAFRVCVFKKLKLYKSLDLSIKIILNKPWKNPNL